MRNQRGVRFHFVPVWSTCTRGESRTHSIHYTVHSPPYYSGMTVMIPSDVSIKHTLVRLVLQGELSELSLIYHLLQYQASAPSIHPHSSHFHHHHHHHTTSHPLPSSFPYLHLPFNSISSSFTLLSIFHSANPFITNFLSANCIICHPATCSATVRCLRGVSTPHPASSIRPSSG